MMKGSSHIAQTPKLTNQLDEDEYYMTSRQSLTYSRGTPKVYYRVQKSSGSYPEPDESSP
jgi:hypothetical protein